jgi:glycolate oxidase FAD binding subunit
MPDRVSGLYGRLCDVLGAEHVELAPCGPSALDIHHPVVMAYPGTVEQVAEVLRIAAAQDAPVVALGWGSRLTLGNVPAEAEILLTTRDLGRTLDYEPRDLTVVVEAGKRLASLQEELAPEGQFLAFDPPNADAATVGGVVSTNASGLLRRAYGAPRDLTLGLTAALADGSLIRAGGRVVKNVAGYDTTKLFVGSLGTLGVVVEAAFRLHPLPETEAGVLADFPSWDDAMEAARRLAHTQLQPRFLEAFDRRDSCWGDEQAAAFSPSVLVGFGGPSETVRDQATRAQALLGGECRLLHDGETVAWRLRVLRTLRDACADDRTLVCRTSTVMTSVSSAMEISRRLAAERDIGVHCLCHYASGVAYSLFRLPDHWPPERAVQTVEALRKEMAVRRGVVVAESAPVEVRRLLDVWGPPTGPIALMQQLKRRLDPHDLLNRGRFLRGVGAASGLARGPEDGGNR